MKTDFEKFRKWHRCQVAWAMVLLVLSVAALGLSNFRNSGNNISWIVCIVALIVACVCLKTFSYSRCPHCGKSVMSKWNGRDAAGRNCAKRIAKHLPILCFNCGQEIDTAN